MEILLSDLFTEPTSEAPICDGYEHSLSSSADDMIPFKANGITLNATHLVVSATSDGKQPFFVVKQSQASRLTSAKQVVVEVYTCTDLQIPQAQSDGFVLKTLQKNQGATVLYEVNQLQELFASPSNSYCNPSEWYVSNLGSQTRTTTMEVLSLGARPDDFSPIFFNDTVLSAMSKQVEFQIWTYLGTRTQKRLNQVPAKIRLILDCNLETLTNFFKSKPWTELLLQNNTACYYQLPFAPSSTPVELKWNLYDMFELLTDKGQYCNPVRIEAYKDESLQTLTSINDAITLTTNPDHFDITTSNYFVSQVQFSYLESTTSFSPIWLKAILDSGVTKVVKLEVSFCNLKMARLKTGVEQLTKVEGQQLMIEKIMVTYISLGKSAASCLSRQNTIQNVTTISGNQVELSNIQFFYQSGTNYMKVDAGVFANFTFDWVIQNWKSREQLTVPFMVTTINKCSNFALKPKQSTVNLYVQIYQMVAGSYVVQVLTAQEITELFQPQTEPECSVSDWKLTMTDDQELQGSFIARTAYNRKKKPTDPMQVDTYNTNVHTINIKIWVYLRSSVQPYSFLNPYSITISVHNGCFKEQLTEFWGLKQTASGLPYFGGFQKSILDIVFPRSRIEEVFTIQLSQIFKLQFDFKQCGPKQVTAYQDSGNTRLVGMSEPVNLSPNPALKQPTQEISPVLKITTNATFPYNQVVYLVADTGPHQDNYSPIVKKSIQVSVSVCDDQPQPLNLTYNISITQGQGQFSINVSSLFTQIAYKFPAQCKNESFILSITNHPTPDSIENIELIGTLLSVSDKVTLERSVYLHMLSIPSLKAANVAINIKVSPQELPKPTFVPVNKPPFFNQTIPNEIKILVNRTESGSVSSPKFEYKSPDAVDPEGDPIQIITRFTYALPNYIKVTLKASHFVIEADLTAVTKPETIQMEVFVGSSAENAISQPSHKITIQVVVNSPPIEVKTSTSTDQGSKQNTTSPQAGTQGATSNQSNASTSSISNQVVTAKTSDPASVVFPLYVNTTDSTSILQNLPSQMKPQEKEHPQEKVEEILQPVKGEQVMQPVVSTPKASQQQVLSLWTGWKQLVTKIDQQKAPKAQPKFLTFRTEFSRNGIMKLIFNQNIFVPEFKTGSERRLVAISEIDVGRDMLDINFDFLNPIVNSDFKFSVDILSWSSLELALKFNFSDPLVISQGNQLDKVYVKIKNPDFFRPLDTDVQNIINKDLETVVLVPKQLPQNLKAEQIETLASKSSQIVLTMLIIQLCLQILLKGSLKMMIELYLTMQLLVYVLCFNLKLPALTEIILIEFKNLIEFRALNIEAVVQMFEPGFSLAQWLRGTKQAIINDDQKVSIMADLNVYLAVAALIMFILVIIMMSSLVVSQNLRAKIHSKLAELKQNMVWNGLVNSLKLSYFKFCLSISNQVRLIVTISPYQNRNDQIAAIVQLIFLILLIATISRFLWCKYNQLFSEQMVQKYGNMFYGTPSNRDKLMVLKLPSILIHRLLYSLIASSLYLNITFSLQLFVLINLLFTMYMLNYRAFLPLSDIRVQILNDSCAHLMFVQLFLFTDFHSNPTALLYHSFIYITSFVLIIVGNIGFQLKQQITKLIRVRQLTKLKKELKLQQIEQEKQKLELEQKQQKEALNHLFVVARPQLPFKQKAKSAKKEDSPAVFNEEQISELVVIEDQSKKNIRFKLRKTKKSKNQKKPENQQDVEDSQIHQIQEETKEEQFSFRTITQNEVQIVQVMKAADKPRRLKRKSKNKRGKATQKDVDELKEVLQQIIEGGEPDINRMKKLYNPKVLFPHVSQVINPVFLDAYKKPMDAYVLKALKVQQYIQRDRLYHLTTIKSQEAGICLLKLELSLIWINIDNLTKLHLIGLQMVSK